MTRNRLRNSLEISILQSAILGGSGTPVPLDESGGETRQRIYLNGTWERYIGGKPYDLITVPSSLRPAGYYQLKRKFVMPRLSSQQRAVVHFEAITYHGRLFINGNELGTMAPYVPHEFDITPHVNEGSNDIAVAIADIRPDPSGAGKDEIDFGVVIGWEVYGGIIRDVYVEICPAAFIDNVRFGYKLEDAYRRAVCRAQVQVSSSISGLGQVEVRLFSGSSEVARAESPMSLNPGRNEVEISFSIDSPALWSPQAPNLYHLVARSKTDVGHDQWQCRTGFREINIQGSNFLLNGEKLVLNGICRMELWKDQGFTMTRRQMRQDMVGIKMLGCNFVRLQPFPHHREIIELADELGLLVSEEPGYWWANFETCPRSFVDLGLNVLERNIRRDWNSPAVMFWFLGNESYFTVAYLREGKALCNRLDPIFRPVSMAHQNYAPEKAKKYFDEAGLDFYDWHAYEFAEDDKFARLAEVFGPGKPLTFSEWGWEIRSSEDLFWERHCDMLANAVKAGKVAGHMFFDWNDDPQFSRRDWATHDGILYSGVVKESREVRPALYQRLSGLFRGRREDETTPPQLFPTIFPLRKAPWAVNATFETVNLQPVVESPEGKRAWKSLQSRMADYWARSSEADMGRNQWSRSGEKLLFWEGGDFCVQRATFRTAVVDGYARPVVVTPESPEISIPVGLASQRLHFLGHITLPTGYPTAGREGELVATYTLNYTNGKKKQVPLRNGIEVARGNTICAATRLNPIAVQAQRAVIFTKDITREEYQGLLFTVTTGGEEVSSVACTLRNRQWSFLIFAITAERA